MDDLRSDSGVLSIVVPLYNEEGNVDELIRQIRSTVESITWSGIYEIVCVNDGSTDTTLQKLRAIAESVPQLVIVDLSRNFGHQLAATAGMETALGDAVILMDGDLQDPPELIGTFIERWREGYDVVYATRRSRRGESAFKRLTARAFYRIVQRLTNVSIPVDTGDFRLMSRRVVNALKATRERHRFIRGLVSWVGYKQIGVPYDRDARHSGTSKYPLAKMVRFAIDGITSFSEVPLRFASYLGFLTSALAFIYVVVVLIRSALGYNEPGYTSTIITVLFLGGVQLVGIGILGEYIGRIYEEIKARPLYLVADVIRSGTPPERISHETVAEPIPER